MFKKYPRAIFRSFYDPLQYQSAIAEWRGIGALYLLLLSAFISVFAVGYIGYSAYVFNKNELPAILAQMPVLTIENGLVSVDREEPVIIQAKAEQLKIIIDTQASPEDFRKRGAVIGIGKDFIAAYSGNESKVTSLKSIRKKITIDRPSVQAFFRNLSRYLPFVVYPVAVLSQFINYLFQAFLIAFLSYAVTAFLKEKYTLETRMRMAALALTPAVIISTATLVLLKHQMDVWVQPLLALLFMYVMLVLLRRTRS